MELTEHEKAILAIESLAQQIGDKGVEINDQLLKNIASCLRLYLISTISDDLNAFLDHTHEFRLKKLQELEEEMQDLLMEQLTGKKVSTERKILRKEIPNDN